MKKFNKKFEEFLLVYEMNTRATDILEGDVVSFKKDYLNCPYLKTLPKDSNVLLRIKEMISSGNTLIVHQLKTTPPTSYGSFGHPDQNKIDSEGLIFATVSEQYTDGLHKNIVVVPLSVLQKIDVGNNQKPVSPNQVRNTQTGNSPAPDANDPKNDHPGYRNRKDLGINKQLDNSK